MARPGAAGAHHEGAGGVKAWIVAMWSFKDRVGIGFFAGTLLHPEPPVAKMSGPWNRSTVKARRVDLQEGSELDEVLLRSWLSQARELPGWGTGRTGIS